MRNARSFHHDGEDDGDVGLVNGALTIVVGDTNGQCTLARRLGIWATRVTQSDLC
jgi:hypothetical protein